MPELRMKEVRLPELHLPEMSRDEIVRAIGDARRDVDLTRLDPRRIDLPDRPDIDLPAVDLPRLDLRRIDLSKVDVAKAITAATQAAGLIRASRRPRLPIVAGGIVAVGLIGFAIATSPAVRPRLDDLARRARQRVVEWRASRMGEGTVEGRDAETLVAIPIEPAPYVAPAQTDVSAGAPSAVAPTEPETEASEIAPA